MDCGNCANTIRTALERLPGVSDIRISITKETLALVLDERLTAASTIESQIGKLGYSPSRLDVSQPALSPAVREAPVAWWRQAKGRLAIISGGLVALAYLAGLVAPRWHDPLFIAASLIAAAPVARRAFASARAGAPFTIEMLMTIAVIGALFIGAAEEAAIVVFLFCVGEVLEGVAASRARSGIRALGDLVPQIALLEVDGRIAEVSAATLAIGQVVLVRPGDRIPADGTVIEGLSSVDEASITGESVPRRKVPGSDVFAGTINHDAALKLRVGRAAQDNMIARIVALVEEAQDAKAPTERFIDRFSRLYMPFIVGLSALVAVLPPLLAGGDWGQWIYRGLALLLIGCPCALVISVPAAIASSLAAAARRGLLIKGGAVMESLAAIQAVAFDKTGTLTLGTPAVTDVLALVGNESEILAMAAAVERRSSHPLAAAIVARADADGLAEIEALDVAAVPGKGMAGTVEGLAVFVGAPRHALDWAPLSDDAAGAIARLEGEGKTVVVVVSAAQAIGIVALLDEPRPDSAAAIAELKALGIRPIMLTGDNRRAGAAIGEALGIETKAEMLPSDKAQTIRAMAETVRIAMVGDGINDAPALASAHVGIAMGSGTRVALEAADAALLHNRVADVAALIRLARATMANIRQNIAIALGLKGLFLVTTVIGATGLWVAILADTGGTVLVTLNALRLLGYFSGERASRGT
ncbi:heavy metal translocating P-type ATPase [Bosea sp. 124]|uniref:heavy metal translocating P-type ATPase n=1 Tax=Bosea sp. 124 TaxID=2135642 RepID=UPI002036A787|nr:heavy metal translocating P-type ATPase [Bosea sp. 124]